MPRLILADLLSRENIFRSLGRDQFSLGKSAVMASHSSGSGSNKPATTLVTSATVEEHHRAQAKTSQVDDKTTRAVFKLQFAKNELHDFSNYVKNWDLKPDAKLTNRAQIMELHIRVKHAEQMWRLYFNQQMDCSGVVDSLDLDSMRRDMIYTRTIFFRSLAKAYVVLGETRVYFDDDFFDY